MGSFTTAGAVSLENLKIKTQTNPFWTPPPLQLSCFSSGYLTFLPALLMGNFFFLIYVLHFLVLLMGDEGKDDSSNESFKIPTPVPENPGKLALLCFYHRYPLSR